MDPSPAPQSPSAEALFAEFLDRLEAGEAADFEALCAQHPARASALRKVHVRWQAMSEAFTHLSHDANGAAAILSRCREILSRDHESSRDQCPFSPLGMPESVSLFLEC